MEEGEEGRKDRKDPDRKARVVWVEEEPPSVMAEVPGAVEEEKGFLEE
jgi:hypothetical protein